MIVVSDTSCLCYLARLGVEEVLWKLFHEVMIPPAVADELLAGVASHPELKKLLDQERLQVVQLRSQVRSREFALEIDVGEAEAIALAEEIHANYLLVDDAAGRALATELGIPVIGLLGVLLAGKKQKCFQAIGPMIERLVGEMGFRASDNLVARILQIAGEEDTA